MKFEEDLADALMELINSRSRSPTKAEMMGIIRLVREKEKVTSATLMAMQGLGAIAAATTVVPKKKVMPTGTAYGTWGESTWGAPTPHDHLVVTVGKQQTNTTVNHAIETTCERILQRLDRIEQRLGQERLTAGLAAGLAAAAPHTLTAAPSHQHQLAAPDVTSTASPQWRQRTFAPLAAASSSSGTGTLGTLGDPLTRF